MIQKQILALCLYQDFWKDARRILNAKMFPKELNSIFVAISDAHKKYEIIHHFINFHQNACKNMK